VTLTVLTGREALTLGCDATAARGVLPTRLELEAQEDGQASVGVLLFALEDLRLKGLTPSATQPASPRPAERARSMR